MTELETVDDLDDDRTVHKTSRTGGDQRAVHLDAECRTLDNVDKVFETTADRVMPETAVCKVCTGSEGYRNDAGENVQATREKLLATDPDEVGLSPLDDREDDLVTDGGQPEEVDPMFSEDRRCPECGQLADVVLEVRSIGTGLERAFGTVHSRKINGQGQSSYWKVYGHGGRA